MCRCKRELWCGAAPGRINAALEDGLDDTEQATGTHYMASVQKCPVWGGYSTYYSTMHSIHDKQLPRMPGVLKPTRGYIMSIFTPRLCRAKAHLPMQVCRRGYAAHAAGVLVRGERARATAPTPAAAG